MIKSSKGLNHKEVLKIALYDGHFFLFEKTSIINPKTHNECYDSLSLIRELDS